MRLFIIRFVSIKIWNFCFIIYYDYLPQKLESSNFFFVLQRIYWITYSSNATRCSPDLPSTIQVASYSHTMQCSSLDIEEIYVHHTRDFGNCLTSAVIINDLFNDAPLSRR